MLLLCFPLRNNENNNNNNNHNAAAFHKQVVLPLYHVHITLPHIHRNIYDAQRSGGEGGSAAAATIIII